MPSRCVRKMSTASSPSAIRIEIVYAQQQRNIVKSLSVPQGALLADALNLAALDVDFQDLDLAHAAVGIYGSVASRDRPLKEGDRIEIYRPLAEEPKLARRRRARPQRTR
jgi:putative ubiquitin-RnfH superfamily antitoxin RatB of RatAB toxin-antitoxin module